MLRTYFQETFYDMSVDVAQKYADIIRDAIIAGRSFEGEKKQGFYVSRKRGFEDKLYVGDVKYIERRLEYRGEKLEEDDQIINVIVIDGPVTRDGDGCSYGSKDHRDQILYANTIPQVVGHIFIINTPGGAASARIDYEQAIADCREKGKPTVAWVDGMCCSAGQLVAALCDRTIAMNGRDTMGCIGTMCAFWGVPNGTVDGDGYRYIELVSVTSPDKNAEYREAVDGKTEKLQEQLDVLGEEFRETVRQYRPRVKEEHLTGKTFDADEVMGALVDEIGDYTRAIETVFELADGKLPAASTVMPEEEPKGPEEPAAGAEQKDMAQLSEQQRAAINASAGGMVEAGDGHVRITGEQNGKEVEQDFNNPQKENNMEKTQQQMAAEAEAAKAAQQEHAQEQAAAEEPAQPEAPAAEEPAQPEAPAAEEPAQPEAPAAEEPAQPEAPAAEEPAQPEAPAAEESAQPEAPATEQAAEEPAQPEAPAAEEPAQPEAPAAEEPAQPEAPAAEEPAQPEAPAAEEPAQPEAPAAEEAEKEIDRITETLHNAEALIAERDKEIAQLKDVVESQKKALAEKDAEIKELASNTTPMTTPASGVPAGNGTGKMPKSEATAIRRGMSYEEIRRHVKNQGTKSE